ncbi:prevent-host-death protein [Methylococcaceae bacterium HT1]|nr:prevent-host-death protein [Methylococcaceae bacterium HT1]TXL13216.1 prevent-host-death protein [Methylococcaceae bacterium HT3]
MSVITANDLKRSGVSGIERAMINSEEHQVLIDVRGKTKYVVLDIEEFNHYREYQLDKAINEAEQCLIKGRFSVIDDLDNFSEQLRQEIKQDA